MPQGSAPKDSRAKQAGQGRNSAAGLGHRV